MNDSLLPQHLSAAELDANRTCGACESEYSIRSEYDEILEFAEPHKFAIAYASVCTEFCNICFDTGRWVDAYGPFDRYILTEPRTCSVCKCTYRIGDYWPSYESYFPPPYGYETGCYEHCISCWLTAPEMSSSDSDNPFDDNPGLDNPLNIAPDSSDGWPYERVYHAIFQGDLKTVYQWYFDRGNLLAVMPCSRLQVRRIRTFPGGYLFFPVGFLDLQQWNIHRNSESSRVLSEVQSAASRVDEHVFNSYPLVAFPVQGLDWQELLSASHKEHLSIIRQLSESVDSNCLDYARFKTCSLKHCEGLPCQAGQVADSNMMMAGLALYSPNENEGRIVAGAAFNHCVTQGLGMTLEQYEWDKLPAWGETGQIARRGLRMYSELLYAGTQTSKFVQTMSLFEFLAYPDQFAKMEEVKKLIARYSAPTQTPEYERILTRFLDLTGREEKTVDPTTGKTIRKHLGFRTRIVHLGERLEQIVPSERDRNLLFAELQSYLMPVLQHMIQHSSSTFDEYKSIRAELYSQSEPLDEKPTEDFDVPF
jgi:hypothetical protein